MVEELLPWFSLKSVPGIGNLLFKRLIDRFGLPQRVFAASTQQLVETGGISGRLAAAIRCHRTPEAVVADLKQTLRRGYHIVTLADPFFPSLLGEIPDPPPFLYVHGRLDPDSATIAVVGSRHATDYGRATAKGLCTDLAAMGTTIVSGMALGIDTAAHEGALEGGGKTVAVLGSGLGVVYPAANRRLFDKIAQNGAVISEFALMAEPEGHHFPARNRIISGMSLGTVVVEATRRSGSLITARLALEQNREVFAVPGSVQSFKSTGTHALIKQGAKLVEHAGDIMEEFAHLAQSPHEQCSLKTKPIRLSDEERTVYGALGPYPTHIDRLVRDLAMAPGKLAGILLQLELRGIVRQEPGSRFSLTEQK